MLHNRTRAALAAGAVLISIGAAAACSSSSPTAPDPAASHMDLLAPGSYMLLVSTTPNQAAACRADPPRPPMLLGVITIAALTLTHDGQTWVARAANGADGDIELRLRHVRDDAVIGGQVMVATIEGTIRGTIGVPGATVSDRVSFGTATATRMDGSISRSGSGLGTMTGEITQSNSVGSFSCPMARWTLSRGLFPGF